MDRRIPQLPYIPGSIDPAAAYLEVAFPDVSSDTGYTSTRAYVNDILASVPTPSVGNSQVAFGSPIDGTLISSASLTYNDIITSLGLNYPGASIYLNNASISDATDRLVFSKGNVNIGEYVGVPSISAIHMNVLPGANNYILAATMGGASYLNGDTINYAINGAVKASTNASYTQYTQPFAVGSISPSGSNAFVVGGESFLKGISMSSSDYLIKGQDSGSGHLFNIKNNGYAGFKTSPNYPIDLMGWYGINSEQISFFNGYNMGMGGTTIYNRNPQPSGQPFRWVTDSVDGIAMSSAAGGQMGLHVGNNAVSAQGGIFTAGHSGVTTNVVNLYDQTGASIYRLRQSGYQITKAIDAVFADASLGNSEMTHYIDEATDQLIFKVKYSTGVVKTANLLLI